MAVNKNRIDPLTPSERSLRMAKVRSKNTKVERKVRSLIHNLGYRFRLHRRDLPGTPDIVFAKRKKIIFVHGCFWHQHEDRNCKNSRLPKSNVDYWRTKLEKNVARDKENQKQLAALGWHVLVIWECEIRNEATLRDRLLEFLGDDGCYRTN